MFPNPALEGKYGTHQVPVFERMSAVVRRTLIFNLSAGLTVYCSETRSAIMPGQVRVVSNQSLYVICSIHSSDLFVS